MTDSPDILVIGRGLMGAGVAYEAARRGHRVRLLQKHQPGEAYDAAAGMLAPISEAEPVLDVLAKWGLESLARYPAFIAELEAIAPVSTDFRAKGAVHVAVNHDHFTQLEHIHENHQSMGLRSERLGADEVRALEPRLSPRITGGLMLSEEAQVDPQALHRCLVAANGILGVETEAIEGVLRWRVEGEAVRGAVVVQDGRSQTISAAETVVAAGAWSHQLPGLEGLPLRPVKGQVVQVAGDPLLSRTVRTPDVYLVPRSSGRLWIGASVEEVGYEPAPRAGDVMRLLWEARRVLPGVSELVFERALAGFRPAMRDHLPAVGATAHPGLWVSTGHYRSGVLLLPVTVQDLLSAIETGQAPQDLAPFAPQRFGPEFNGKLQRYIHEYQG